MSHAESECNDDRTEGDGFLQSYFRGVSILARFRKNCVCSSGLIPARVQNTSNWTNYTSVVSAGGGTIVDNYSSKRLVQEFLKRIQMNSLGEPA